MTARAATALADVLGEPTIEMRTLDAPVCPPLGPPGRPRWLVQRVQVRALPQWWTDRTAAQLQALPTFTCARIAAAETVIESRSMVEEALALVQFADWSTLAAVHHGRERVKLVKLGPRQARKLHAAARATVPPDDHRGLTGLVDAARHGDMTAWARVWDLTSPAVLARLHGRLSPALAEARTGDVFRQALAEVRGADLHDPLGWLFAIADRLAPSPVPARHRAPWWRRLHIPLPRLRAHNTIGGY